MSDFKTCDQLVEHFDENTKHLIDSDTYDLIRITWEEASAAACDENKGMKSERDALQARVAELVTALQDAVDIIQADANTEENYGSLCRIGNVLSSSNSDALILRKQAEELDIEAAGFELSGNEVVIGRYVATVLRHAANKRRDEADKAGGGV